MDEVPSILFSKLIAGNSLTLRPVPEPELEDYEDEAKPASNEDSASDNEEAQSLKRRPPVARHAQALGINPNFELAPKNGQNKASHNDNEVQTLLYPDDLEKIMGRIHNLYKTAIEETGNNLLYLTFGALEYLDSDDSQDFKRAPLVLLPVELKRLSPTKGETFYQYVLKESGEDAAVNLSLAEKLRREHAMALPPLAKVDQSGEEDVSLDTYLEHVQKLIKTAKPKWRVIYEVNLGQLNFGKLVLFKDLHPENWTGAPRPLESHPLVDTLCNGTKENQEPALFADDYPLDDLPAQRVPDLIYDADSSQHSALIDALQGKNLVIEGPPGTGKSQTITNLIAAAMRDGKKVLFVAEKLAALEVVKKRLDIAGLGDFCLELHSTKVQKPVVLQSFKKRIDGTYPSPRSIDAKRTELDDHKAAINDHIKAILEPTATFPKTYFESVGSYSFAKSELEARGAYSESLLEARPDMGSLTDESKLKRELDRFRTYFAFRGSIANHYGSLTAHPWNIFDPSDSPQRDDGTIAKRVRETFTSVQQASAAFSEVRPYAPLDTAYPLSIGSALELGEILKLAETTLPISVKSKIVGLASTGVTSNQINDWKSSIEKTESLHTLLSKQNLTSLIDFIPTENDAARFDDTLKKVSQLQGQTPAELDRSLNKILELNAALSDCIGETHRVFTRLDLVSELPIEKCIDFAHFVHLASQYLPRDNDLARCSENLADNEITYERLKKQARLALALQNELKGTFALSQINESSDSIWHKIQLLKEASWFSALFNKSHRDVRGWLKSISLDPKKAKFSLLHHDLHKLHGLKAAIEELDKIESASSLLGKFYLSTETDFDLLDKAVSIIVELRSKAVAIGVESTRTVHALVTLSREERDRLAFHRSGVLLYERLKTLVTDLSQYIQSPGGLSFAHVKRDLDDLSSNLQSLIASPICRAAGSNTPVRDIPTYLEYAAQYRRHKKIAELAVQELRSHEFSVDDPQALCFELGCLVKYINARAHTAFPTFGTVSFEPAFIEYLRGSANQIRSAEAISNRSIAAASAARMGINTLKSKTPLEAEEQLEFALSHPDALHEWFEVIRLRQDALTGAFKDLVKVLDGTTIDVDTAIHIAEFTFYRELLLKHHQQKDYLSAFEGFNHDAIRQKFVELDQEVIELTRKSIAAKLDANHIPEGISTGPRGQWTDLALIKHQISLERRHIPIRQLMSRAIDAVQALKPCFMMSPMSVAQFLPPSKAQFDLVVMDEASQLRPEDAIGAIARGNQVVVVGDTKQLPPSNFFGKSLDDDDDTDDDDEVPPDEFESILEQATGVFRPARRLKWHYRSKHESLIAFSNHHFYEGDLILFPTAHAKSDDLGVKFRSVPDGIFETKSKGHSDNPTSTGGKGRNQHEARAIVVAIKEHARKRANDSLGVVTMNAEQRELIDELLLNEAKADPVLAAFLAKEDERREKFFVKNLENVQGDERDAIFISVTYGRNQHGSFHLRFGPINQKAGCRRLNVLFSRAKKRMEVFCSFDPELLAGATSEGAKALREFLEFAKTGRLPVRATTTGRDPDSPFETAVMRAIKALGYDVEPQVGVAGYFLDIAVVDKRNPGRYLLGIECDGATYHSSRSARDRDRLRQQNLEGLGWTIHRIWSTDWFKYERREIQRLKSKIESLLAGQGTRSEVPKAASEAKSGISAAVPNRDAIRKDLVDYRERIIKVRTPTIKAERGILRKSLLETIVEGLPTNAEGLTELLKSKSMEFAQEHVQFIPGIIEILDKYQK